MTLVFAISRMQESQRSRLDAWRNPYGKVRGPYKAWDCADGCSSGCAQEAVLVRPNVRAKLPAEAGAVSLVRDDAPCAADQAYRACRSGSA